MTSEPVPRTATSGAVLTTRIASAELAAPSLQCRKTKTADTPSGSRSRVSGGNKPGRGGGQAQTLKNQTTRKYVHVKPHQCQCSYFCAISSGGGRPPECPHPYCPLSDGPGSDQGAGDFSKVRLNAPLVQTCSFIQPETVRMCMSCASSPLLHDGVLLLNARTYFGVFDWEEPFMQRSV